MESNLNNYLATNWYLSTNERWMLIDSWTRASSVETSRLLSPLPILSTINYVLTGFKIYEWS